MADSGILSASKITTYKGCSMAYYLNYVEHVKVPTSIRMVFGKAIHYMLERFYDINYKSAESFGKYWKYYWFKTISGDFLKGRRKEMLEVEEFKLKDDFIVRIGSHVGFGNIDDKVGIFFGYMKLGVNILESFYRRHKNRAPPVEKEFNFGMRKDEPLEIGRHRIRGAFDRIDKVNHNGKVDWYITDYKTDKSSPAMKSFTLHRHPQFTLYSYAFRELFGEVEKAILYYHLRSGKVYETHRSERDYDYLKKLIDDVVDGIERDKFTPFYGFHCNMCDFKVACEDYSHPYHGGPRIAQGHKIKEAKEFDWDTEVPEWMEMMEV